MEQIILAAILKDRGVYELFERYGQSGDFSPIGQHVYKIVGGYYQLDDSVRECPAGIIADRAARELTNPKHGAAVAKYLQDLPEGVSIANAVHDIREHRRAAIGDKLALALANRSPEAKALLEEYRDIGNPEVVGFDGREAAKIIDIFDTTDLTEQKPEIEESLIKLWPKALNDRCDGGAKRGHHILLFARPEAGKTLVAINMVAGFLHQKLNVLYIGNEEPAADIRQRMRQRLLKLTKWEVREQPAMVARRLAEADLGRLKIAALSPGTFPEVDKLIEEFKPDVLVFDQLRNMRVSAAARVEELETAATQARNRAKRYGLLVISITQAGDSATNKIVLELNDVDGSKTGIPAQMDLMVGIGSTEAMRHAGMLTLSLPKNKLSGDHGNFSVNYNQNTGVIL